MTTAYLDCFSGISGDMLLGALLDAGLDEQQLLNQLQLLQLPEYTWQSNRVDKGSISATKVTITTESSHHHRTHADIRTLIHASALTPAIQDRALAIFQTLAEAEAAIHGVPPADIHFHEVGGVDSIVDIVGTAIGIELLQIDKIIVSPLPMGKGWVNCQHGRLPLPAPAVLKLCQGLEVYGVDETRELVTPTGAAIVKTLSISGVMPPMTITNTGYGAGSHELDYPNILRLVLGEERFSGETQEIEVIQCNLDDWSPEPFPHLCEILLNKGALDVSLIPIHMKKGRPGFRLYVLAPLSAAQEIKETILCETTAIGLRFRREQRLTLPRESVTIVTVFGDIQAKKVETPRGSRIYPEYEPCRQVANRLQIPIMDVYAEILKQTR
ncbi:MAG: nickel pincer cofactor biosynthesis protein LarC [Desulfobulbaceae bacterium]|jgi:uncharacterized protein (TIGR00299 family) protein|nr:nickel pincer cofactor biosynthesis protein LarC [Desulfobulbaceae bacterium]